MSISKEAFEKFINGKKTGLFVLKNSNGMEVAVTNYGARIVTILVPDKKGNKVDVVLGFDSLDGFLKSKETYYGAIVGRFANRIDHGRFTLDGKTYQLSINNPPNHLHGGPQGFHVQVWDVVEANDASIKLFYRSADGEENYPGNLDVTLTYSLTVDGELSIEYEAISDAPTVFNPTSHPFFNLNGQGSGTIENHLLMINADLYNPVNVHLIPKGIESVEGTVFDFRLPTRIGERINKEDEQLQYGAGYDHNYVLNGNRYRSVAVVKGDKTNITLEVLTDQPGMQFYTSNHLKGENTIKYGGRDHKREAFCLETQHFPDSPNQEGFPSVVLRPDEKFYSKTVYKFSSGS